MEVAWLFHSDITSVRCTFKGDKGEDLKTKMYTSKKKKDQNVMASKGMMKLKISLVMTCLATRLADVIMTRILSSLCKTSNFG